MKFAIISDIHGNKDALDAVLKDIEKENVDSYIVAGDLITDFPDDSYVVNKIRELTPNVIKGNREDYLIKWEDNVKNRGMDKFNQFKSVQYTYKNLSNLDKEYIKNLPENLVIKVNSKYSIRVCHGSPFSMYDLILENGTEELLEKSLNEIDENILICAHTHHPFYKWVNNKLVINTGSVGVHYSDNTLRSQYAILEIDEEDVKIKLKNIEYDFQALKERVKNSKIYENVPIWTDLTIGSIEKSLDMNTEFVKEAISISKKNETFENGLIDNETWDNLYIDWKNKNRF